VTSLTTRLACLLTGHRRVMAAMRRADGGLLPIAICDRCGTSLA
jgi:hypothetical protein